MITYRAEETIDRPGHDVFPYLADPKLHPAWTDASDVQVATPGEVRVGSKGSAMMKMGSRMIPYAWEVTGYQADVSFAFLATAEPFNWEGSYDVSPAGGATTRIVASGRVGLKGWQRLLKPFISRELQRGMTAELRRLKELLERPT